MAETFRAADVCVITGGTDNHLLVIDTVQSFGLDGKRAEQLLDEVGLATNKQVIPDDPRPPMRPSGIRLGTPACLTRGMGDGERRTIAAGSWMYCARPTMQCCVRASRVRFASVRCALPCRA